MLAEEGEIYLSAKKSEDCNWRERDLPRLDVGAFLFSIEHNILALLIKLIVALGESSLRHVSGVKMPKVFNEAVTIQTVLQL
jgi:hypothetical protein